MSDIAIKLENISKQYRLGVVGTGTLSHDLNRWFARMRGKADPSLKIGQENTLAKAGGDYVWALKDINLEVKQGEILGIIGKNGAGKSTLLKLLSRVTGPTTGQIKVNGKIASLLEVGTGFHPELTGKENIFLNGAILGMTKNDIRRKLDEIVEFAGVAKYLNTPVKRYSSGMYVRLAFAVAAHLEPDILVVDEVLAVGDAEFQKKAIGKMQDVSKGGGRTVLFVSHNMSSIIRLCPDTVLLENGKITNKGVSRDIIQLYIKKNSNNEKDLFYRQKYPELKELTVQINEVKLVAKKTIFELTEQIEVEIIYVVNSRDTGVAIGIDLFKGEDMLFRFFDTDADSSLFNIREKGQYRIVAKLPSILKAGIYTLFIHTSKPNGGYIHKPEEKISFEVSQDTQDIILKSYAVKRAGIVMGKVKYNLNKIN